MTTYYARKEYIYDGGDTNFSIPFSYINKEHIKVYVNNVLTTNYTYLNDSEIRILDELLLNDTIAITRDTPINERLVIFSDTSILSKEVQNLAQEQVFDAIQEIYDNNEVFKKGTDETIDDMQDGIDEFEEVTDDKVADINAIATTALETAQQAVETSNTAETNSINAVNTSANAETLATQAVETANTANTLSEQAVATSNTAETNSINAVNIANAATQKVDEFGQDIEKVIEAAEKIDELEGAVAEAKEAATQATVAADNAVEAANNATQAAQAAIEALDSKQDKFTVGTGLALVDGVLSNTQTSANWGNITGNIENQTDLIEKFNAVDDKIDELQTSKLPNATIIGLPHIEGSFVSGFSESNYLQFPFVDISQGLPFDIYFPFTTGANITTQQNILDSYFGIALAIQNGKGVMALSSNGTSWDIGVVTGTYNLQPNTTYYAKLSWTGTQYTTALSTDGKTYTTDMTVNSNLTTHKTTIYIGASPNLFGAGTSHPFLGTINFNGAKVIVDNIEAWDGYADIGFQTRANVSLSNLDEAGEAKIKILAQEELNNPYSLGDSKYSPQELNNASWLASNGQWNSGTLYKTFYDTYAAKIGEAFGLGYVKNSTQAYNDYDLVIDTTNETFRLPLLDGSEDLVGNTFEAIEPQSSGSEYEIKANGRLYVTFTRSSTNYSLSIQNKTTGESTKGVASPNNNTNASMCSLAVKKGDICAISYSSGTIASLKLIKAKGNGTLYYYVGETVQNVNLIDVGRITEDISSIKGELALKPSKEEATDLGIPNYKDRRQGVTGFDIWKTVQYDCWISALSLSSAAYRTLWLKLKDENGNEIEGAVDENAIVRCQHSSAIPNQVFAYISKGYSYLLKIDTNQTFSQCWEYPLKGVN